MSFRIALTNDEVAAVLSALEASYGEDSLGHTFPDLTPAARSVIARIRKRYGSNLPWPYGWHTEADE